MAIDLEGATITRDAHEALLDLKEMVEQAAEKIRVAERETIGAAIAKQSGEEAVRTLQDAAEKLQSPSLESAISRAREKVQTALKFHMSGRKAAAASA
jgi:23S rRNA pseudoU1915 N3-methylase RlmH